MRDRLNVGEEEGARLLTAAVDLVVRHAKEVAEGPVAPPEPGTARLREWRGRPGLRGWRGQPPKRCPR
ncbi:hypothetical protein [Nonomuraea dietziae]|uniref:hypothetical protein n=1 Tax=Nonomuraea dietziae TaxID=65515 RepID=UPI0031E1AECD